MPTPSRNHRRIAATLPALIWLGGCALDAPGAEDPPEEVLALPQDSGAHAWVVAVSHLHNGDEPITCTGLVLGSHTILTRAECVPDGASVTEVLFGEDARIAPRHPVHAVLVEPVEGELAVLVTRDLILAPAAELAFEPFEDAGTVEVVGYGLSRPGVSILGLKRSSRWTVERDSCPDVFLHAEGDSLCRGDLGAAAHDANGRVVGLVSSVPSPCTPGSRSTAQDLLMAQRFLDDVIDMQP